MVKGPGAVWGKSLGIAYVSQIFDRRPNFIWKILPTSAWFLGLSVHFPPMCNQKQRELPLHLSHVFSALSCQFPLPLFQWLIFIKQILHPDQILLLTFQVNLCHCHFSHFLFEPKCFPWWVHGSAAQPWCCLQVHMGPFPPISQHGEGHVMNRKPYCEPEVEVWPDFLKCCPANHPKTTCYIPFFWAVFLFLWCGACSSACAAWLPLKLQVAVLICTSQGASLSCWCIILNDENTKSAWLFLIRTAIIFCNDVIPLLIN